MSRLLLVTYGAFPNKFSGASSKVYFSYINGFIKKKTKIKHIHFINKDKVENKNLYLKSIKKFGSNFSYKILKKKNLILNEKMSYLFLKIKTNELKIKEKKIIRDFNPDKIIIFDIESAAILSNLNEYKKIIWLGDLKFQVHWHYFLLFSKLNFFYYLKFPFTIMQIFSWKKLYFDICKNCKVISGSNANIKELKKINIISKYLPYPWEEEKKSKEKKIKFDKPSFIFFGNLSGLGSLSAFQYLIKKIYPIFINQFGINKFQIFITGTNKNYNIVSKIRNKIEFKLLNYQKNLSSIIGKCHAVLFPIDVPVGNRSRVVTCMSSKWTFIAHKNVSIGNPLLQNKKNCFLFENESDFAAHIKSVISDTRLSKKIANQGYKDYKENFYPANSFKKFMKVVNE